MHVLGAFVYTLLLLPRREFLTQTLSLTLATSAVVAVVPAAHADSSSRSATSHDDAPADLHNYGHGTTLSLRSVETAAQSSSSLGPLAIYPDPILRRSASPVTDFGPAVDKVAYILIEGMTTNSTTALQYGIDARIIVLKGTASPLASRAPLVLVNPNVLSRSGEDKMMPWREHCGDIIGIIDGKDPLEVELLRDEVVEVAAQDVRGIPVRKSLTGEAARAFQHELDHLDGLLIIDHAGLDELPKEIAQQEVSHHRARQRRAFERRTYQGNEPLYR